MPDSRFEQLKQVEEERQRRFQELETKRQAQFEPQQNDVLAPSIKEVAKLNALQKVSNPNFEQIVGSPGSGQTFTRRTYGPYQLDTSLESADTKDGVARDKSGALKQSLRYLGGGHSEEEAKKIAKELQEIGKPVDYARWQKTLNELQPSKKTNSGYEGDEYIVGKTVSRTDKGKETAPLWYDEDEEEKE